MNDGAHLRVLVDGNVIADKIIYCSTSASRREGLLSLDRLEYEEGILMEMPGSRRGKKGLITSIHMLGMRFPISVAWLNEDKKVVHSTLAKPWGLYYGSPHPAWYVLETHPDLIDSLGIGTVLNLERS
jgi:uncharacterized membrane protein (UPF0127 family)